VERVAAALERHGDRFPAAHLHPPGNCPLQGQGPGGQHAGHALRGQGGLLQGPGVGLRLNGIRWREVEVVPNPMGKPEIFVSGRAAELCAEAGITGMHLTLTDENDQALAVVVLEK